MNNIAELLNLKSNLNLNEVKKESKKYKHLEDHCREFLKKKAYLKYKLIAGRYEIPALVPNTALIAYIQPTGKTLIEEIGFESPIPLRKLNIELRRRFYTGKDIKQKN